jgi:type VI secretion system secreted protein Hcp
VAVNAYLFIDGITGPSTSKTGFIDILSFSWGVTQTSTYGTGASGKESKAGRANFQNLTIMKVLDATSPLVVDFCVRGQVVDKVYIVYDKPVGKGTSTQGDYFRIYLKDAIVTGQQISGSSENPTESLSFAFQAVEIAYKAETDPGALDAAVPKGWDLAALNSDWAAPDKF